MQEGFGNIFGAVVATIKLWSDWLKADLDRIIGASGKPAQLSFDHANEEAADTGKCL